MKKAVFFTLTAFLIQASLMGTAFAGSDDAKLAEKVRTGIQKLGTGPDAKVKITLKDKTKIEGYIVSSDTDQFVVMSKKTGQPVTVAYSQVKQIKGNNLSTGMVITIGLAAFFVVLVVLLSKTT